MYIFGSYPEVWVSSSKWIGLVTNNFVVTAETITTKFCGFGDSRDELVEVIFNF